jgi:dTDP-glucose 4,6-dehydratase
VSDRLAARSVLVTGAGGFIGGHLAAELVRRGARVRAFVHYSSREDRGTLEWFDPAIVDEIEFVAGDLRDAESVEAATDGVADVFHLAALIAIPYSYANPRGYFETNVIGTLNVAQAALRAGVERVVHTSTSEVYGTAQTVPITEEHPLETQSPYAASKLGADKLMDSFHRSFGLPVTILRPFNTYGPHQSRRAIVPTIITQALTGDPLRLGALDPRRDLTYVSDTVDGFIAAAATDATIGRTVQLGTNRDVSIAELVNLVGALLGRELEVELDPRRLRPAGSEVMRLISRPRLARELMGWAPRTSLEEGLRRSIAWLDSRSAPERAEAYVI